MKYFLFLSLIFSLSFTSYAAQKDTSKVEYLKVYFNSSGDKNVAWENNEANDLWDMFVPLLDRIDSAKYSVDLVAYDLQNMRVAHALANAARRGVRVRVITDDSNRDRSPRFNIPFWDTLRKAGIYSMDDAGTVYHPNGEITFQSEKIPNAGAIMHHKFAVIDVLDANPNDDYVWTGSMNLTYTGNWNTNVTFVVKDNGIAKAYNDEFEEMWGSKKAEPNPNKANFHQNKSNKVKHIHYVNDIKVEVYFGPVDRSGRKLSISKRITELINEAKHDVHFLAFAISPNIDISRAMIERSGRGEIELNGVIDPAFYARYRNQDEIWSKPEMNFGNRSILSGREVRKLHAKTIIIDTKYPYSNDKKAIVIAGSYNFSIAAEKTNDENILIIHDNAIANQFYQDFKGVQNRANRMSFHRFPTIDTARWYEDFRISKGSLEVELETGLYYPVSLLGVEIPRTFAGNKDSCFYYSAEGNAYFEKLIQGKRLKFSSGKELPDHLFGRYHAYITAQDDSSTLEVNGEMIKTGNGTYSYWNRQQADSIKAFKTYELFAKENALGMWEYPDSVGVKKLNDQASVLKSLFPLDLNIATAKDLEYIPGVGKKTALLIEEYVNSQEKVSSIDELLKIKGIGPATLEKLKQYLYVESEY